MSIRDFFRSLASAPNELPNFFPIPDANIANQEMLSGPFVANQHYFSLDVNGMYLTESRRWLSESQSRVIILTEYSYANQFISNPYVVGSSMLRKKMQGDGEGFVFRDTRVAGLHPYTGGRLNIN